MSRFLRLPGAKSLVGNLFILDFIVKYLGRNKGFARFLENKLFNLGFECKIQYVDHHLCHVSSAIHTSGFEKGLGVSYDAQGDGYSSKVYKFSDHGKNKTLIYRNPFFKSLAHYYSYVTLMLGFKLHEHEGKITGLSAYGNPEKTFPIFNSRIYFDERRGEFIHKGYYVQPEMKYLKERLKDFKKEDIAAGIQKHLEENMMKYFHHLLSIHNADSIVLAGGVFGNVLLNQKISEIGSIKNIHIHPHMGDGGLAFGAAAEAAAKSPAYKNRTIKNVFWGPSPEGCLETLMDKHGIMEIPSHDMPFKIAELLARGNVIGFVEGRMEYGPRALCHRSILANPFDKNINDVLNKKLKRTEFMPFAPIILDDEIENYLVNVDSKMYAMNFMTITCKTKEIFQEQAPAVNHIDNTARPQIVYPYMGTIYDVLSHFRKITACPILINTSFNMHGEPIVNTFEDAIKSFLASRLDYLYLEGRLFSSDEKKMENDYEKGFSSLHLKHAQLE